LHQEVCCLFHEEVMCEFHADILWCLCCCNRLRLWGDAGQLIYIPVFSLVQVHHKHIAHMWHLSPFGRCEDHLWTSRLRDGQRQVLFSGVDGLLRHGCLFCQCRLLFAGTCSKSLAERVPDGFDGFQVQVCRYNFLPTSSGWAWVLSAVGWIKHQKLRPNCQLVQTRAQLSFWHGGQIVVQHWSVVEERSRKAGASYFSSGGIDIHEVLHVEMLVEQSSSRPSQSRERSTLDWKVLISFW